jgi:hypothetical protein
MQKNKKPTVLLAFANDKDDYLPNINTERRTLFATLENTINTRKSESVTVDDLIDECGKHSNILILHYGGHAGSEKIEIS